MRSAREPRDGQAGRRATNVIVRGLTARLGALSRCNRHDGMASACHGREALLGRDQCVAFLVFQGGEEWQTAAMVSGKPEEGLAASGRTEKATSCTIRKVVLGTRYWYGDC